MAVPRNRHSNARKNSKRAHHAKRPASFANCGTCGAKHLPHTVCKSCGFYKGRQVLNAEKNLVKTAAASETKPAATEQDNTEK